MRRKTKCPCCGSTKTVVSREWFKCKKCGYLLKREKFKDAKLTDWDKTSGKWK